MPIQPESFNLKQNAEGRLYNAFMSGVMTEIMGDIYFMGRVGTVEFSDSVREVQEKFGLEIDGCLGDKTIDALHLKMLERLNKDVKGRGLITKNFKLDDFASGEKKKPLPPKELMPKLRTTARLSEVFRSDVVNSVEVEVASAYRTLFWNTECGGEKDSFHMKAIAADLRPKINRDEYTKERYMDEFRPDLWMKKIDKMIKAGLIPEGGYSIYLDKKFPFRHGDNRGYKARW